MTNDKRAVSEIVEEAILKCEVLSGMDQKLEAIKNEFISLLTAERRRADVAEEMVKHFEFMTGAGREDVRYASNQIARLESRLQEAEKELEEHRIDLKAEMGNVAHLEKEVKRLKHKSFDKQELNEIMELYYRMLSEKESNPKQWQNYCYTHGGVGILIAFIEELEARLTELEKENQRYVSNVLLITSQREREGWKKIVQLEASLAKHKAVVGAVKEAIKVTMRTSGGDFAGRLDETYKILNDALASLEEDKLQGGRE